MEMDYLFPVETFKIYRYNKDLGNISFSEVQLILACTQLLIKIYFVIPSTKRYTLNTNKTQK